MQTAGRVDRSKSTEPTDRQGGLGFFYPRLTSLHLLPRIPISSPRSGYRLIQRPSIPMQIPSKKPLTCSFRTHGVRLSILLFLSIVSPLAADPVVSNVSAVQRVGTGIVDITYDVDSEVSDLIVSLRVSKDGGSVFLVPAGSLDGDAGANIAPGIGKLMTWSADGESNSTSGEMRFEVTATHGADRAPAHMSLIPAGSFSMGETSSLTPYVGAFYIGRYEVTKALWDEVRAWGLANGYQFISDGQAKGANHPVHSILPGEMILWCNMKSEMEGLSPVYRIDGAVMRSGVSGLYRVATADWTADGYRLPTETEWEKAAQGGIAGQRFPWGDTISHLNANYFSSMVFDYDVSPFRGHIPFLPSPEPYTSAVPYSSIANGYGLYDVCGNVAETCWDLFAELNLEDGIEDPRGPDSYTDPSHDYHVVRGGSWGHTANFLQTFVRESSLGGNSRTGFRFARRTASGRSVSAPVAIDLRIWSLSIDPATDNGSIEGAGSFIANQSVSVRAIPNPGYRFQNWSGALTGSANPTTLTMDADQQVGAIFVMDTADDDSDGVSNFREIVEIGTDPNHSDSDRDGLSDGAELLIHGSNPLNADSDGDGLGDRVESLVHGTNPMVADTDGDGFDDATEILTGFDPTSGDSTPEALSSIRMAVEFRFHAADGVSYRIESSTDLVNWTSVETNILGEGVVISRHYPTEGQPKRYFRARRN